MPSVEEIRQNQIQTTKSFVAGYNAWDISKILAPRTPNCTQQVIPASLGRPVSDNETYRTNFAQIMQSFKNFTVTVKSETHDPFNHSSALHASSTADTAIGSYANEYTILLKFTDDGTQLTEILEFVDSGYSTKFFLELREHAAKHAQ